MTARADIERIRRQARALDVIGWVFTAIGLIGAAWVLVDRGVQALGDQAPTLGVCVVASLALRAHAEVYRLRTYLVEVIERVGADR